RLHASPLAAIPRAAERPLRLACGDPPPPLRGGGSGPRCSTALRGSCRAATEGAFGATCNTPPLIAILRRDEACAGNRLARWVDHGCGAARHLPDRRR